MTAVMILSMSSTVYAHETEVPSYSVTINEYDIYFDTRSATASELARSGIAYEDVSVIKSSAIEGKLASLSVLSNEELSQLGYNTEQINTLQNYTGERIETTPQLRGVFANMSLSFSKVNANTNALAAKVTWVWSNAPVLAGATDIVGIRWQGTNTNGQSINLALNSGGSSCKLKYYNRSGVFKYEKFGSVSTDGPYGLAYS